MKLQAVILLAIVAVTMAAKFKIRSKEDAINGLEDCRAEFPIPDDIYEQFLNYVFPEHKNTNCFIKCFVEKMGLFTDLKGFNENNFVTQFTYKNYKNLESVRHGLEKCIDKNEWETDNCTWANRVFGCWLKVNRHVVRMIYGLTA